MRWLRLLGSLKLQVSFAEYRPFHRALLQKRPVILRSLLIVATPYKTRGVQELTNNLCLSRIHTNTYIYTHKHTHTLVNSEETAGGHTHSTTGEKELTHNIPITHMNTHTYTHTHSYTHARTGNQRGENGAWTQAQTTGGKELTHNLSGTQIQTHTY